MGLGPRGLGLLGVHSFHPRNLNHRDPNHPFTICWLLECSLHNLKLGKCSNPFLRVVCVFPMEKKHQTRLLLMEEIPAIPDFGVCRNPVNVCKIIITFTKGLHYALRITFLCPELKVYPIHPTFSSTNNEGYKTLIKLCSSNGKVWTVGPRKSPPNSLKFHRFSPLRSAWRRTEQPSWPPRSFPVGVGRKFATHPFCRPFTSRFFGGFGVKWLKFEVR